MNNKLIFPFLLVVIVVIAFAIKLNYKETILENSKTTTGKVIKTLQKGKLPYCEFTYTVNNITYNKKQEVPMHLKNKVTDSVFTVVYNADNPKESYIDLK